MPTSVRSGGAWRTVTGLWVRDSGTWRQIQKAFVRNSGTWREVYSAEGLTSSIGGTYHRTGTSGTMNASIVVNQDGTIGVSGSGGSVTTNTVTGDAWYSPTGGTPGNNYWVRFSLVSGTTPNLGLSLNTWYQITTSRSIGNTRSTLGTTTSTVTVELAASSGGTVLLSGNYTMTAAYES